MRLPRPGRPHQEDVLTTVEILTLHEFQYLRLIDARPCCEVELVEYLRGREPKDSPVNGTSSTVFRPMSDS